MVIRRVGLCAVAFGSCLGAALGLHSLVLLFNPLASLGLGVAAIGAGCVLATALVWVRSGQPDRFRVVGAFVVPALVLAVSVMVAPLLLATAMGVYLGLDAVTRSFAVAAGLMTLTGAVALVRTLGLARAVTLVLLSLLGLASFAPVGAAAEPVVLDVTAPMLFRFTSAAAIAVALLLAVAAGAWAAFMYADAASRGVEAERSLT